MHQRVVAKLRADVLLVEQGLSPTRSRAQALILAGAVTAGPNRLRIDKPGTLLSSDTFLQTQNAALPYVSRGGLKLARALQHFDVPVANTTCLDVGASTGGFTDCLLQRGARKVFALDVGYGQLAWDLRQDPRVVVLERTNVRTAAAASIPDAIDLVVADVSFISLRLVLPHLGTWLADGAYVVALIKPQFELEREAIGKGGIVTCAAARARACDNVERYARAAGIEVAGICDSPIAGAKGNQEFLLAGRFVQSRANAVLHERVLEV